MFIWTGEWGNNMGQKLDEKKMLTVLDELYSKALDGIPKVSKPIEELAEDYIQKNSLRKMRQKK